MRSDITTPESALPAADETVRLFDDWFDPIETGLRARVREFIEGMIRTELVAVLARPRYARRGVAEEATGASGDRHAAARVALWGHSVRPRSRSPRSPRRCRRHDQGVEEHGAADLPAAHACCRRADRLDLSRRHQHAPGPPRARSPVRWRGRQRHGQPGMAEGEERLGCLERPLARRGTDRPADPGWYRRPG